MTERGKYAGQMVGSPEALEEMASEINELGHDPDMFIVDKRGWPWMTYGVDNEGDWLFVTPPNAKEYGYNHPEAGHVCEDCGNNIGGFSIDQMQYPVVIIWSWIDQQPKIDDNGREIPKVDPEAPRDAAHCPCSEHMGQVTSFACIVPEVEVKPEISSVVVKASAINDDYIGWKAEIGNATHPLRFTIQSGAVVTQKGSPETGNHDMLTLITSKGDMRLYDDALVTMFPKPEQLAKICDHQWSMWNETELGHPRKCIRCGVEKLPLVSLVDPLEYRTLPPDQEKRLRQGNWQMPDMRDNNG